MVSYDLVVIGAGAVGAFHALFAARDGMRVALVDRDLMPGGASVRNFGMCIPSGMAPGRWLDLARESAAIYRNLAEAGAATISGTGSLYLAFTDGEAAVLEEFAASGPALGHRCDLLDPDAAVRFHPALRRERLQAALHFPDDLQIDQRGLFRTLIPWMVETLGVTWLPGQEVVGFSSGSGGIEVMTAAGERITGSRVLACPGPDLARLFPGVAAEAGIRTCKLQMLRTAPLPGVAFPAAVASGWSLRRYDSFARCPSRDRLAAEPMPEMLERFGIHILLKQEADGSITLGDSHQYAPDPAAATSGLDPEIERAILAEAAAMVDLPSWPIAERWAGWYPVGADDALVLEPEPGIHIAAILGGKGMTCAPAFARDRIAEISGSGRRQAG
jgi:D-hydroxyproline dehydrogenase subunit beta